MQRTRYSGLRLPPRAADGRRGATLGVAVPSLSAIVTKKPRGYALSVELLVAYRDAALANAEELIAGKGGKRGQIYFLTGKRGQIYFLSAIGDIYVTVSVKEGQAMPRKARIVIPGVAHHVVQRGHNRQGVFAADEDFQFYLENLTELKGELDVRLYAYCLMTNHVHLLLMPAQGQTLASLLKALAGRQTRYVNRVEGRSGTLWEGRYKSSPVDTESYLLECSRYIELNPLRAGIVGRPEQYRWSSFGAKAGLWEDRRLDLDPCYLAMGETEQQRQSRYAAFVSRGVRPSELMLIREALQRGQLTGSERFVDEIDRKLGVRVERRGQGRPAKCKK